MFAVAALALIAAAPGHARVLAAAQDPGFDHYVYYRDSAVRIWQNYELRAGQGAREVFVAGGDAEINGQVNGDVHVILGNVRLGGTAVIDGTLFVVGGDVFITEGAVIRRDLGVVGGVIHAPPGFNPGGSHVVFGADRLGNNLRAIVPWVSRGLLWGRLIVPSIGWVWGVVFAMLIVTLALNLVLHRPVAACAATVSARPFSAFMAGLLMLLLVGPISALMAVSVIGIAVVPFFLCGVIAAWIVGKVGVSRWIGATIVPSDVDSRLADLRAVLLGFAALCLVYMVPILGLVTWAMVGVFGLGSATLALFAALRRERPAKRARGVVPPVPAAFAETEPVVTAPPVYEVPPPPPPFAAASASTVAADTRGFPRAQFLDRLAAGALDLALLVMFNNIVHFGYGNNDSRFLFALLYFVVFWAWKGTTLGGIVCNLRVTRIDGAPLQFSDALVRGLAAIFSIGVLGLGFLWILSDPERQAWHDRIAGTFVVKVPRDWPLP
jgi:uncharacterized RDD family membrane protein YckC